MHTSESDIETKHHFCKLVVITVKLDHVSGEWYGNQLADSWNQASMIKLIFVLCEVVIFNIN